MVDRTAEDIAQDNRITMLEGEVKELAATVNHDLGVVEERLVGKIDALSTKLGPLEGLADEFRKIQEFFASIGKK